MNNIKVNLEIDTLVLDGLPHVDQQLLAEKLKMELESQFLNQGVPGSLMQSGTIANLSTHVPNISDDANTGTHVANTIYNEFLK